MNVHYTREKNTQVLIALLKAHSIRHVIASPGNMNTAFVGSIQHDSYFKVYSSVDERSAAYMACGLAAEIGEPVVISCTGATASRNYLPGMTEAFYRKLPVLAITSSQIVSRVGHHSAQMIDRSVVQKDVAMLSVSLPVVKDDDDLWDCEIKVNQAILALKRHGGGPVHINLPTTFSTPYDVQELPEYRIIDRIIVDNHFPVLADKVAVFVGAHKAWTPEETEALDRFCSANDAVVFCDHTSGYNGKYRLQYALATGQEVHDFSEDRPDVLIHIGEITGDYFNLNISANTQVWRVNEDGEIRDTFRKLRYVFEMPEKTFFSHYAQQGEGRQETYFPSCKARLAELRDKIPVLPFSNIWLASKLAHRIPEGSAIHFGILNSLRAWNFYELPPSVASASNVGGFGIDGGLSSLVGASLANKDKLYYMILGDLAFFYDMNVAGNRHIGRNLRILLVNNGKGTEFRQYNHHAAYFGVDADEFIAAAGHFGNKSPTLVKHYAEDLGFEYFSASNEQEFDKVYKRFLTVDITERSMIFEVFTDSTKESAALQAILNIEENFKGRAKHLAKQWLGESGLKTLKKIIRD
ncbi:MAG: thiamine pyrophosphate-binding protein [Pseudomonadota bacterium]